MKEAVVVRHARYNTLGDHALIKLDAYLIGKRPQGHDQRLSNP